MLILKVVVFHSWDVNHLDVLWTFFGMNGQILNAVDRIEFEHGERHVLWEKSCHSKDNFFALPDEERKKRLREMLSPTQNQTERKTTV